MNITRLELLSADLGAQRNFYGDVLDLPVTLTPSAVEVKAGATDLTFKQAWSDFEGAYHFAFNIPESQFYAAKEWISSRVSLLQDSDGQEEFPSESWNSDSIYFLDAGGNVLEFIARHNLRDVVEGEFNSKQILKVSEIGLPAEDVIGFANKLCTNMGLSVFMQPPNENFTPVGDDHGLFILSAKDRIWKPDSGVPATLLSVRVMGETNGKEWGVRGVPYEIMSALAAEDAAESTY